MSKTITEAYRAEQQKLHENNRYGVASIGYAPLVWSLLAIGGCNSLSDYGAGKRRLRATLGARADGIDYFPYDPAFPFYGPPLPADLVACIDVLEHIEPQMLNACLDELASITRHLVLMTVHTGPAKKVLGDGRNAHLIQEPPSWWLPQLSLRFDLLHVQHVPKGFFVIGCPKGAYRAIASKLDLPAISRAAGRCEPRKSNPFRKVRGRVDDLLAMAKRDLGALWFAARDKRTPLYAKMIATVAFCAALSPFDLTPDVIPVVGSLDDILLLFFGLLIASQLIPNQLMTEFRWRAASLRSSGASYGAIFVGVFCGMAALLALLHASRPIPI